MHGPGDELFEIALLVNEDQQSVEGYEIIEFGSFTLLFLVFLLSGTYMLVEAKVPQGAKPFTGHKVAFFYARRK